VAWGSSPASQRIVGFDLGTGDVRDVMTLPDGARSFEFSPDGDRVAVLIGEPQESAALGSRIVLCSVRGDAPRNLYGSASSTKRIVAFAWHPDGQLLVVGEQDGTSDTTQVVRVPLATRLAQRTGLSVDRVQTLAVSPDGARLAVGHHTEPTTEVVMLTGVSAWLKTRR
jgi:WD40 repeat protein